MINKTINYLLKQNDFNSVFELIKNYDINQNINWLNNTIKTIDDKLYIDNQDFFTYFSKHLDKINIKINPQFFKNFIENDKNNYTEEQKKLIALRFVANSDNVNLKIILDNMKETNIYLFALEASYMNNKFVLENKYKIPDMVYVNKIVNENIDINQDLEEENLMAFNKLLSKNIQNFDLIKIKNIFKVIDFKEAQKIILNFTKSNNITKITNCSDFINFIEEHVEDERDLFLIDEDNHKYYLNRMLNNNDNQKKYYLGVFEHLTTDELKINSDRLIRYIKEAPINNTQKISFLYFYYKNETIDYIEHLLNNLNKNDEKFLYEEIKYYDLKHFISFSKNKSYYSKNLIDISLNYPIKDKISSYCKELKTLINDQEKIKKIIISNCLYFSDTEYNQKSYFYQQLKYLDMNEDNKKLFFIICLISEDKKLINYSLNLFDTSKYIENFRVNFPNYNFENYYKLYNNFINNKLKKELEDNFINNKNSKKRKI